MLAGRRLCKALKHQLDLPPEDDINIVTIKLARVITVKSIYQAQTKPANLSFRNTERREGQLSSHRLDANSRVDRESQSLQV